MSTKFINNPIYFFKVDKEKKVEFQDDDVSQERTPMSSKSKGKRAAKETRTAGSASPSTAGLPDLSILLQSHVQLP